jgi:16S rRNA (guanine966-N2)-methyltransferase
MKIVGGTSKGRYLITPKGVDTRPALARVRNSLFNILAPRLPGQRVLDLFAGTGSLGLEALSRDIQSCLFVENNRVCVEAINQNIKLMKLEAQASVVLIDVFKIVPYLIDRQLVFDMIFVAPPYPFFREKRLKAKLIALLEELVTQNCLAPDGLLIMEHRRREMSPEELTNLKQVDHRNYGQTELMFLVPNKTSVNIEPPTDVVDKQTV